MSKAFTRESDDVLVEEAVPPRSRSSDGGTKYITKQGALRFGSRLNDLVEQRRLSEGARIEASMDTKTVLRRLDLDIQTLQSILDSSLVAETPDDQGKVAFGAFVRVRDQDGEEETYQIVGFDELEPGENRISSASPLGRALLSKRAGDKASFQSPAGKRELDILEVHY